MTGAGVIVVAVEPVPNCPLPPAPQQYTVAVSARPHAKLLPTPILTKRIPPAAGRGTVLETVSPVPKTPAVFAPQQYAAPTSFSTHETVCCSASASVGFGRGPITIGGVTVGAPIVAAIGASVVASTI